MFAKPLQYSLSTLLVVTFLVAVGMTVGPVTWFLIAVVEVVVFMCVMGYFSDHLPAAIEAQMSRNATRSDGSKSSRRESIEKKERKRFLQNFSILLLIFLAATNVGLLTMPVERLFESEMYLVDSPEVLERPGRMISEAQYAREIGAAKLKTLDHAYRSPFRTSVDDPIPALLPDSGFAVTPRFVVVSVLGSIWFLTVVLVPIGYLGMLRTLSAGVFGRAEYYKSIDHLREIERVPI